MAVADDMLHRVRGKGRGFVFTVRDLDDLGTRAALDQALARLARTGVIRRLDRGVYDFPRLHPVVGPMWPSADAVAQAVARQTGSHLKGSGPLAANLLGLTTQVPAQTTYLTDGPSRSVHVGKLLVDIRHAGRVDMLLPDTVAGLVITALRYLGRDAVDEDTLKRLSGTLDAPNKRKLRSVKPQLAAWLGAAVDRIAAA
ncbi:MAG: DUF6088 family protein [Myxococcota bacterium]